MSIVVLLILITGVWVLGIKIATSEGMVLEKMGKYGKQKVDEGYKIFEALWVCEWCMPSIHSLIGYAFAFGLGILPLEFDWKLVIMYPLVVSGTSLFSGLTWTIYLTINSIHDYYKNSAEYFKNENEEKNQWQTFAP